jgi:hypothetical protein
MSHLRKGQWIGIDFMAYLHAAALSTRRKAQQSQVLAGGAERRADGTDGRGAGTYIGTRHCTYTESNMNLLQYDRKCINKKYRQMH